MLGDENNRHATCRSQQYYCYWKPIRVRRQRWNNALQGNTRRMNDNEALVSIIQLSLIEFDAQWYDSSCCTIIAAERNGEDML